MYQLTRVTSRRWTTGTSRMPATGEGKAASDSPAGRQGIWKAILFGLALLVAGDIIRTVAVSPTFASAGAWPSSSPSGRS
jgi:Protein of unknown function (DUF1622)